MAGVVLDTGALIAVERGTRVLTAPLRDAAAEGVELVVPAGCVAQAFREGQRQVRLVRFLRGVEIVPLDAQAALHCGALLRRVGGSDVIDAAVAVTARPGDVVLTSDPRDITALLDARGLLGRVRVLAV